MYPKLLNDPLVSVIVPAHNAAAYLAESLDSVLAQTYSSVELIVVDDGSTDETPAILARYAELLDRSIHQDNRGVSAARNAGVEVARGEYVAFLDADDRWHPRKLERQMDVLRTSPDVAASTTGARLIDVGGAPLGTVRADGGPPINRVGLDEFLATFYFLMSSLVVRRDALHSRRPFDESLDTAEDLDLMARIAARHPLIELRSPLTEHRVGDDTLSSRLCTGNRLRVLDQIATWPVADDARVRRRLDSLRAEVLLAYGDDMLWRGSPQIARGLLADSLRLRPSFLGTTLLIKSLLPTSVRRGLKRGLRALPGGRGDEPARPRPHPGPEFRDCRTRGARLNSTA